MGYFKYHKPYKVYNNVGDWVMSVVVKPEYENRLFTMSIEMADIYIYDTETELFVDGPVPWVFTI